MGSDLVAVEVLLPWTRNTREEGHGRIELTWRPCFVTFESSKDGNYCRLTGLSLLESFYSFNVIFECSVLYLYFSDLMSSLFFSLWELSFLIAKLSNALLFFLFSQSCVVFQPFFFFFSYFPPSSFIKEGSTIASSAANQQSGEERGVTARAGRIAETADKNLESVVHHHFPFWEC